MIATKRKVHSWKEQVGRCPFCRRCIATYVPAKGDGSARLFNVHKDATGSGAGIRCQGSKTEDPEW
jgi:hypothetical protein